MTEKNTGKVLRISGTIIDVQFPQKETPHIFNALIVRIPKEGNPNDMHDAHVEVAQQLGDGIVRCIALEDIANISRGLTVINTHSPIKVPVGTGTL